MINLIDRLSFLESVYLKKLLPLLGLIVIIATITSRQSKEKQLRDEVYSSVGSLLEQHLAKKDLFAIYRTISSFEKTISGLNICLKDKEGRILYGEVCSPDFVKLDFKIYGFSYFMSIRTSPYNNLYYELGFTIVAFLLITFLAKNLKTTIYILKNDLSMIQTLNSKGAISYEANIISRKLKDRNRLQNRIAILEKEESHARELRSIAHDLRSPLTVLRCLSGEVSAKSEKERLVEYAITRCEEVCESLLNRSNKSLQLVNISHSIFDFCKTKELEHNQSGLKINLNVHEPEIKLDSRWHKLERVLSNLVNNSVESYSSNRPTLVDIDLFQVNKEISIIVRDYGCGIDINSRESLFKQNFSTKPSGNGIGLFQAKAYLESIGGKIKYIPKEKGTSFKLTFPQIHTSIINQGELSSEPQHSQYSSEHSEKVLQ